VSRTAVIASAAKQSSAREARKPKTVSSRNLRLDCFVALLLAMTSVANGLSKLSTGFEQALKFLFFRNRFRIILPLSRLDERASAHSSRLEAGCDGSVAVPARSAVR
jgi:hypothetical protein